MKYSGIEWIGEIPNHWTVTKLKFLTLKGDSIKPGPFGSDLKTSDFVDRGFKIYNQKDILNSLQDEDLYVSKEKFNKLSSFQVQSGDLLLTSRGSIGKSMIVPKNNSPGIIHPCLIRVRVNEYKIDRHYVDLIFNESDMFKENIRINSNGTVIDVIYGKTLKEILIPVPELNEQQHILEFLEKKMKTIDDEISKNKKLITLLQEQRQSTINHAVTKGLDDTVPMKESGIEWIGEIPEHWKVKCLKYVSKFELSTVDRHEYDEEIPVSICHYPQVYNNHVISENTELSNGTCNKKEFDAFRLKKDDVLITKDSETPSEIGVPAYVDYDFKNVVCGYHLAHLTTKKNILLGNFLFRYLQSNFVNAYFETEANGITRFGLGKYSINNLKIPLPSNIEQKNITNYLDQKTTKTDELISKVELQIKQLQEFRESLISSAVTGKIQVAEA